MDFNAAQDPQWEMVKAWLRKNGRQLVIVLSVAFAVVLGWKMWQGQKMITAQHASVVYTEMVKMNEKGDLDKAKFLCNKLQKDYSQTVYSDLAGLMLARYDVESGNLGDASKELQNVSSSGHAKFFRQMAILSLARLQISQNKFKQSIDTLDSIRDKSLEGWAYFEKARAYEGLGDNKKAAELYGYSKEHLSDKMPIKQVVEAIS